MFTFSRSLCAALALSLAACAPTSKYPAIDASLAEEEARRQKLQAVQTHTRSEGRLGNVSYAVLKENAPLCGDAVNANFRGIGPVTLAIVPRDWRGAYREAFGVADDISVLNVVQGSPADMGGLRSGDRIVQADYRKIGSGKAAYDRLFATFRDDGKETIRFAVERNGTHRELTVGRATVCSHPVTLVSDDAVNAWADGSGIHITTGMMRFASKDEELAFVIGHELAHNTRNHIQMQMGNRVAGAVLGALLSAVIGVNVTQAGANAGTLAFSQAFEAEADYVGVYHAARAGYDVRKLAEFWRRMSEAHPDAIRLAGSTHPSTAKRFLAVKAAVKEIAAKRAAGEPLIPDERE